MVAKFPDYFVTAVDLNSSYEDNQYNMRSPGNACFTSIHENVNGLRECIRTCIQDVCDQEMNGMYVFYVCKNDGAKRHYHLFLSFYFSDLPECNDMCSVNRNGSLISPCHRCTIYNWKLQLKTKETERSFSESMDSIYR